jgi:hypothetical protein
LGKLGKLKRGRNAYYQQIFPVGRSPDAGLCRDETDFSFENRRTSTIQREALFQLRDIDLVMQESILAAPQHFYFSTSKLRQAQLNLVSANVSTCQLNWGCRLATNMLCTV